MCKYEVKISLEYGNINVPATDNYNQALDKYREVKQQFNSVPCEIILWNNDKGCQQFISKNKPDKEFDKLYNQIKDALNKMTKIQIELLQQEEELSRTKNKSYHAIEETDINDLDLNMLINLKLDLSKRRIIKENNQQFYAFFDCYNKMIELLKSYKNEKHDKLLHNSNKIHQSKYYKESINVKKKRLSVISDL